MDLLIFTSVSTLLLSLICIYLKYSSKKFEKHEKSLHLELMQKNCVLTANLNDALAEVHRLENLPVQKKQVLTIEAQQILHDLTAHGESVVRIQPINPTDVFWRSPR
jgi:hypothetical protein